MMQQLKAENDQLRAGGNPARVQHNSGLDGLLGGGSPQGRLAANVQRPRSGQLVSLPRPLPACRTASLFCSRHQKSGQLGPGGPLPHCHL